MSKWFLSAALMPMLACTPNGSNFAGGGNGLEETGYTGDTADTGPTSECPPTFGDPDASIDDYPGKGWVIEVTAPFEEGSCDITDGSLYLEFDDGEGGTTQGGPYTIGFNAEDVYVDDYDDEERAGKLFYAFTVDSDSSTVDFTMWVAFDDGSESTHLAISVN